MNDKDKEAFDEWLKTNIKNASVSDIGKVFFVTDFAKIWQAACEYKEDELMEYKEAARSEAEEVNRLQAENTNLKEQDKIISNEIKTYIEIDRKLQAENKKLREALGFYADASYMYIDGGKIAREALKEITTN
jgi:regulator of replication initiation timing